MEQMQYAQPVADMPQPPPMEAPPGQLVMNVKLPDGSTDTWDERHLATQLQQAGFPVMGFSADGTSIAIADAKGNSQPVPVETILAKFGVGLQGMSPQSVDYSTVHPGWRGAISAANFDDDMKKAYLESKVKREWGIDAPKVMGQGSDWHLFHNGQWRALTNKPGMDMSDVADYGSTGLNMLGSALGGAAGTAAAGPVGTIGGAGLGAAGTSALQKAAVAALDPDARAVMGDNFGSQAWDVAKEGALGGVAGGLPLLGKGMTLGPLSGVARGASNIAQATGDVIGKGAGWLAGKEAAPSLARGLGINAIPGAGSAQALGWLAQLPAGIARGAGKLFGNASKTLGAEEAAAGLTRPRTLGSLVERGAAELRGTTSAANNITARDILGNAGEALGKKIYNPLSAAEEGLSYGAPYAQNMAARQGLGETINSGIKSAQKLGNLGERTGSLLETAAKGGKSLEQGIDKAARGLLYATQGASKLGSLGARAVNKAATAVQPFEIPFALQSGLRNLLTEEQRARFSPSLLNQRSGTIMAGQ